MTTHNALPPSRPASLTALVVEPDSTDLIFAISTLSLGGLQVTVAESFQEARALLEQRRPRVLITELRLQEYNGLHLVLRAKAANPLVAAVVMSAWEDSVLRVEAEKMGATFVLKPTTREEMLAAVVRTCFRRETPEGETAIRAPFERRLIERRSVTLLADRERRALVDRRRSHGIGSETPASVG